MEPITLEIIWIAAGIFYGLGQAVIGVITGQIPKDTDELIPYLKQAKKFFRPVQITSSIVLLTAVGLTIAHAVYQHKPESYIVATVITISSVFTVKLISSAFDSYRQSRVASSIKVYE